MLKLTKDELFRLHILSAQREYFKELGNYRAMRGYDDKIIDLVVGKFLVMKQAFDNKTLGLHINDRADSSSRKQKKYPH